MRIYSTKSQRRLLYCILATVIVTFILLFRWDDTQPEPCANSKPANQSLHKFINTEAIDRLILHSPSLGDINQFDLVFLVISAPSETEERRQIRQLWAHRSESELIRTDRALIFFVVGRSPTVSTEAEDNKDILQVDLEESYRNMVYKIETSFRWVREKLKADFVVKIDSDTVSHVDRLLDQLRKVENEDRGNWIACFHYLHSPPIRDRCSPWYISEQDFPGDSFSTYCNGPGYVMKWSAFGVITNKMKEHKIIEVEDAFFTGIVAGSGKVELKCLQEVIVPEYTPYSTCESTGPSLAIVPTHYQFGASKFDKNLTLAWERLKMPYCHTIFSRILSFLPKWLQ